MAIVVMLRLVFASVTLVFRRIGQAIWRFCRILWVCRVPATSALGGGALVAYVAQALDLFADTGLSWWQWLAFFALLLVWACLVHAMARRALQFDDWVPEAHRPGGLAAADRVRLQDLFYWPATWIPRILGLFVIAAVMHGIMSMRGNLAEAGGLSQAAQALSLSLWLLAATGLVAGLYVAIVLVWRETRARLMGITKEPALLAGKRSFFVLLLPHHWQELHRLLRSRVNQFFFAFAIFTTGVFVAALVAPGLISSWLPRALFLPVLLGGGLLLFGEIASLSHRYATPLVLLFFLGGGVLNLWLENYNDVRWIASATSKPSVSHRQIGMAEAVARWKAANCTAEPCAVRPIVIAAAGGASRAGFFTASLVGALLDAQALDEELGDIRNRIFAMSTVSGSSVSGVMMRAAWLDALERGLVGAPPCKGAETTASYRSRSAEPTSYKQARPSSWRDCFQQLLAGDFLSPVFVGIAYRDIFPLGNVLTRQAWGVDRTALLEQAFERWYREAVPPPDNASGACEEKDITGLCRRLDRPDQPAEAGRPTWIPLLFVNGTSVTTGRRILVSDVKVDCLLDDNRAFFNLAYDYRELRDPATRNGSRRCADGADDPPGRSSALRLSTVATMSARFPIISTQGVIRDLNGEIVDSIVDGGYFENDGLATAADIVRELEGSGLHPLVIQTVSEPDEINAVARSQKDQRPPLPKASERSLFDTITSIGRALYATRSGQEDGHLSYLQQTLHGPLISIGVQPLKPGTGALCRSPVDTPTAMKVVSMSWWISQPVQAYLDAQLCAPEIDTRLICELHRKVGPDGTPTGAECAAP